MVDPFERLHLAEAGRTGGAASRPRAGRRPRPIRSSSGRSGSRSASPQGDVDDAPVHVDISEPSDTLVRMSHLRSIERPACFPIEVAVGRAGRRSMPSNPTRCCAPGDARRARPSRPTSSRGPSTRWDNSSPALAIGTAGCSRQREAGPPRPVVPCGRARTAPPGPSPLSPGWRSAHTEPRTPFGPGRRLRRTRHAVDHDGVRG